MQAHQQNNDKTPIVFAFYANDTLLGYRESTMGQIGDHPKIYHYSEEQVNIVLRNIQWTLDEKRPELINFLKKQDPKIGAIVANGVRNAHNKLTKQVVFEVRVLECPENEYVAQYVGEENTRIDWPVYPAAAMEEWIKYPTTHRVIETHVFGTKGVINLQ